MYLTNNTKLNKISFKMQLITEELFLMDKIKVYTMYSIHI